LKHIRVIHKVRKTQHQNPEFDHTHGEIQKKPANRCISIRGEGRRGEMQKTMHFGGKLSFIPSFLFPERLHCNLKSERLASTSVLLYEIPTCRFHAIRVPPTTLVEIMEVFTCASYFTNMKSWTVYGEDQLNVTTRVNHCDLPLRESVVGAMFVFGRFKLIMFFQA
jgi:hypothetical protein